MDSRTRRLIPPAGSIATILVAAGVLSWMFVDRGLLLIAGLGAFGPGLLREVGWLKDHDEFQRDAARRAGYHAYIVGGLAAVLVLSLVEWGTVGPDESAEWLRFVVVLMWLAWLSSTLLIYWGPVRTVSRVLVSFGCFWGVFVVATLVGEALGGQSVGLTLLGTAVGVGVVAPFFTLAWTARKWPRRTGAALLGIAVLFVLVFARPGALPWATIIMTQGLLSGPFIVCGLALLLDWGGGMVGEDDAAA